MTMTMGMMVMRHNHYHHFCHHHLVITQAMMEALANGYDVVVNGVASDDNVMAKDVKKESKAVYCGHKQILELS